jgi:hypothetical protein
MRILTSSEVTVKLYKIHLMEMVINAIYYNPVRPISSLIHYNLLISIRCLHFTSSSQINGPTSFSAYGFQTSTVSLEFMTRSCPLRPLFLSLPLMQIKFQLAFRQDGQDCCKASSDSSKPSQLRRKVSSSNPLCIF